MHKSDPIQVDRQNKSKSFLHMAFIPSIRTLSLVAFFAVGLLMNGDIKPMIRRGFYCDDSSIKYPYKQDTIDIKVLMFVALVVPGLLISICDRVLGRQVRNLMLTDKTKFSRKRRKVSDDGQLNGIEEAGEEEHELIRDQESVKRRHLQGNGVYSNCSDIQDEIGDRVALAQDESGEESDLEAFSRVPLDAKGEQQSNRSDRYLPRVSRLSVAHFSIGKIVCGRFRPHFLQRCQPDVDCTSKANTNRYIEDFACTNNNLRSRDFSYITTSWPSGHASIMFYSMLYLILFLNNVIPIMVRLNAGGKRRSLNPILLYTTYILMMGLAGYIALTRVSDYHHHPLDVLSGSVIGSLTSIVLYRSTHSPLNDL